MWELSKRFRFDAAHTLRREVETESSRRIHGHSYEAEVTLSGQVDERTGMLLDLALLTRALEDARASLDHHFLDEIADLGPATLENLSRWIWNRIAPVAPGLTRVSVRRDSSGDSCAYFGNRSG